MLTTIRHILCPTDFSKLSMKAIEYAEQLARDADAELTLLHAFEIPATYNLAGQERPRDPRLQQQLNELLVDSVLQDKIHRRQHAGPPGEVICWMAEDRSCDLIVMGTHGRTGLSHLLFGSVAEYVLQHARCPVVTIRERSPNESKLAQPLVMPIPAPLYM